MHSIFWIIMIIIDIFFVIFALARAFTNNESVEKKLELEESISNLTTTFISPLLTIGILISTITTLIAIWG